MGCQGMLVSAGQPNRIRFRALKCHATFTANLFDSSVSLANYDNEFIDDTLQRTNFNNVRPIDGTDRPCSVGKRASEQVQFRFIHEFTRLP